jgi:hypothetical protein
MAVPIPSGDTLSIITGMGAWAGVWHSTSLFFNDGPIMIDRAFKMATLPFIYGFITLVGYVSGVCVVNSASVIFGSMFHPVPFVVNVLITTAAVIGLSSYAYVKEAFKSTAEQVAEEIAADAADAAATEESEDESEASAEEEEETADDEATMADNEMEPAPEESNSHADELSDSISEASAAPEDAAPEDAAAAEVPLAETLHAGTLPISPVNEGPVE